MTKAISFAAALLALAHVAAAQQIVPLTIAVNAANVTHTQTVNQSVQGSVDAVYVNVPASQTADVTVVAAPAFGSGLPSTILFSNTALTASTVAYPRIIPTDTAGATGAIAGASHVTGPFLSCGDTVTLRVLQASAGTNTTWRAFLKVR